MELIFSLRLGGIAIRCRRVGCGAAVCVFCGYPCMVGDFSSLFNCTSGDRTPGLVIGLLFTVKYLISAVSNFRGSMKLTYWCILIFAIIIYHGFQIVKKI